MGVTQLPLLRIPPRTQRALWWERSTTPDEYGRFSYAAPLEIECRWDEATKEFRDPQGQTVMSVAVCYPDRVLSIGDMLKEGDIESDTALDPLEETNVYEIKRVDRIPNFRQKKQLIIAFM